LFEPNWFGEFGRRLEKARLAWVTRNGVAFFTAFLARQKTVRLSGESD
jgi:hypothetical protein